MLAETLALDAKPDQIRDSITGPIDREELIFDFENLPQPDFPHGEAHVAQVKKNIPTMLAVENIPNRCKDILVNAAKFHDVSMGLVVTRAIPISEHALVSAQIAYQQTQSLDVALIIFNHTRNLSNAARIAEHDIFELPGMCRIFRDADRYADMGFPGLLRWYYYALQSETDECAKEAGLRIFSKYSTNAESAMDLLDVEDLREILKFVLKSTKADDLLASLVLKQRWFDGSPDSTNDLVYRSQVFSHTPRYINSMMKSQHFNARLLQYLGDYKYKNLESMLSLGNRVQLHDSNIDVLVTELQKFC